MGKIDLVLGSNFDDVNIAVIKKIDVNTKKKNLVLVPDSFSLMCEKLILNTLNVSSYFNIEVMGITGFANLILKKLNLEPDFVNKNESKLLIRKAIKNLQGKLKCFVGEVNSGLIDLIFNSLSLFKSNEVSATEILQSSEDQNELLKNKLQDISLILEEYQKLLKNKFDGTARLDYLNALLPNYDLSGYNVFFVNFDAITKQGFTILKNISKTANQICVGAISATKQKNSFIFENDIYEKISKICEEEKIQINVEIIPNSLTNEKLLIHNNLFGFNIETNPSNFVKVFECENKEQEILNCAKNIKKLITNQNARYKNIAVACADINLYKPQIENIFNQFNFSYFVDAEQSLLELEPINFILNILDWVDDDVKIDSVIKVCVSDLSPLNKEEKNTILSFIEKYNICSNLLKDFEDKNINLIKNKITINIEILKNLKNKLKNIKNYINLIKKIINLFNLQEIIENKINYFKQNNYLFQEKLYLQIFPKLDKVLNSLEKIIGEDELEFKEFKEIFLMALSEESLSNVPLSTDAIYIGDATTSFFENVDYLFVLGANENLLPRYLTDNSIIDDDVIKNISQKIVLSPTVKMINRRNKFKVFNLLKNATKNLFVSYSLLDDSNKKILKSMFVSDLLKLFGQQNFEVVSGKLLLNYSEPNSLTLAKHFAELTGTNKIAKEELLKNISTDTNRFTDIFFALDQIVKIDSKNFEPILEKNINNKKELLFPNNKTKISQIEKFYACPFAEFMAYGLKLKQKETAELNTADVGNILHKVAEEFLSPQNNYLEKIKNNLEKINKIIEKIIKKIEKNNYFYKINLKINKISYKIIKEESLRFCNYLYEISLKTKFKPMFLEYKFTEKNDLKINVLNQNFSLVGVVDRIDVYNDYFNIYDYKTGTSTMGNNNELFYGDKLQIFVYAKAIAKILNKKVGGVYYFPISNTYIDEGEKNPYYLKGKNIFDNQYFKAMDTSLNLTNNTSQIFPCSIKTNKKALENGNIEYSKKPNSESKENFDNMINYSIKMVENAIQEILENNIEISPRENSCKNCPYFAICHKNPSQSGRKNVYKVKSETFGDVLSKGGENE